MSHHYTPTPPPFWNEKSNQGEGKKTLNVKDLWRRVVGGKKKRKWKLRRLLAHSLWWAQFSCFGFEIFSYFFPLKEKKKKKKKKKKPEFRKHDASCCHNKTKKKNFFYE
eukprot:TRINITY_DN3260_c0_g1_i1.p1 TRINITY_DN3260_c0_g1~~TRINITY_DN3260_c0_g1_i1.p1  ORF type:complete len:109 (+),score=5.29 TRINITY_DN3260_c0_g1_i1:286-612(+)